MFRLVRLARMARIIRLLRTFPELVVMVKALGLGLRSVSFTVVLMLFITYVAECHLFCAQRSHILGRGRLSPQFYTKFGFFFLLSTVRAKPRSPQLSEAYCTCFAQAGSFILDWKRRV